MVLAHSSDVGLVVWREGGKQITMVSWPSWLRHRANNAGISGSIPLETILFFCIGNVIYKSFLSPDCKNVRWDYSARTQSLGHRHWLVLLCK